MDGLTHDAILRLISAAYPVLTGKTDSVSLPGVGLVYRDASRVVIAPAGEVRVALTLAARLAREGPPHAANITRLTRSDRKTGQVRSEAL